MLGAGEPASKGPGGPENGRGQPVRPDRSPVGRASIAPARRVLGVVDKHGPGGRGRHFDLDATREDPDLGDRQLRSTILPDLEPVVRDESPAGIGAGPAIVCAACLVPVRGNRLVNHDLMRAADLHELRQSVRAELDQQVGTHAPDAMILISPEIGTSLHRESERDRLRTLLASLSDDLTVIAHMGNPAQMLAHHYAQQVLDGRRATLQQEIDLTKAPRWWDACIGAMPNVSPDANRFEENQGSPFWLDVSTLQTFWETGFGPGRVRLNSIGTDPIRAAEIRDSFDIPPTISFTVEPQPPEPSAAWVTRARQMNLLLQKVQDTGKYIVPRQLWLAFLHELETDGPRIDTDALSMVSDHFACDPRSMNHETTPTPGTPWAEADPDFGFRASQYLLAFKYRIDKAMREQRRSDTEHGPDAPKPIAKGPMRPDQMELTPEARAILPPQAQQNFITLQKSPYAPHDRIGKRLENSAEPPFSNRQKTPLTKGSTGRVIVGCMKNEAPYILEWIAYHRAIGFDTFLIYTNDCADGTDDILSRLQDMGILHHRKNDNWSGKSPQQHALRKAMREPVIRQADWVLHIDVDEFVNVRTGNGTLDDFLTRVPDATNVAMTWRLFGHNDVKEIADRFVIDQFDHCAPKYCPKSDGSLASFSILAVSVP